MIIGIIANYYKNEILKVLEELIFHLSQAEIKFILSDSVKKINGVEENYWINFNLIPDEQLANNCDIIVSIGGDGTMLQTAYFARFSNTPIIGVNFGKLGFLADFDTSRLTELVDYIKKGDYVIEKRKTLAGKCISENCESLYAVNDIVIDRGRYPKMIEITIHVDDEYVSTFLADGIIISTPTGSTGYSLSVGGPIVNPQSESFVLSPISPHSLTIRPLVISNKQKITIKAESPHNDVQVICDGKRVEYFNPPAIIEIITSDHSLQLIHKSKKQYFETLRKKLHWGIDLRKNLNNGVEK